WSSDVCSSDLQFFADRLRVVCSRRVDEARDEYARTARRCARGAPQARPALERDQIEARVGDAPQQVALAADLAAGAAEEIVGAAGRGAWGGVQQFGDP